MVTTAAIVFCVLVVALAAFQVALIAGAPIGRFAWGGQHEVLPRRLRIGSAVSLVLYALFCLVVLERAGVTAVVSAEPAVVVACWVLTAYLLVGVVMNAISRSRPERYTMTPVALMLAGLSLVVAVAG